MNNFKSLLFLLGLALICTGCSKQEEFDLKYCEFDGQEFGLGSVHPEDECLICRLHPGFIISEPSFRWRYDCCVIDDKIFTQGEINPENACQFCDPDRRSVIYWETPVSWWRSFPPGTACDGGQCDFNGNCLREGYCLIGGIEFANGDVNPSDSCMVCRSEVNSNFWTNNCCSIFGEIYLDSTRNPVQDCWWCDVQTHPENWTYVPKDFSCYNGLCNGLGSCLPE